ncbi:hypothetical protein D9611_011679 [Ephemerocybe angulata]|uniref:NACHT domain-containing protein n=1 Tax=Ephemerocybe angulata TaxID=980116 RepID=A0A8H5FG79_9AGAR|nr:hypothetical protein D9611_011679 [Tulosesus angulatus]
MPETRVAVQDEILGWILDGNRDAALKKILWVTGPAGTGKTAILGTIADNYKEMGMLGASFFFSSFSGSADRRSKHRLIPTLAYQLLQHETLKEAGADTAAQEIISRDPAVLKKRLQAQLDALILDPLRVVARRHEDERSQSYAPLTILVDGLDECDLTEDDNRERRGPPRSKEDDQREILSVLLRAATSPVFPFSVIIASRPEQVIRDFFDTTGKDHTRVIFLDESYNPDADIRLFYNSKFSSIRRIYGLPEDWPGKETVELLVENASGQFVYAATTIRFIEGAMIRTASSHGQNWSGLTTPDQRLKRVLQLRPIPEPNRGSPKPFERLDILYRSIIETCPDPLLSIKWLRIISILRTYPPEYTQAGGRPAPCWLVRLILEISRGDGHFALGTLASLLTEKSCNGDGLSDNRRPYITYSFYHKSLLDFLDDPVRCGNLFVPLKYVRDFFTRRFFQTLNHRKISI